jgi:monothiol glutaredoxin
MSPCVEINGQMLADVSGDEVEAWMVENGLVEKTDVEADAPTNASCSDEQHAAMARAQIPPVSKIRFFS